MIWDDDTCTLWGDVQGDRLYLHSALIDPHKPSHVKHYRDIIKSVCNGLKERGISKVYTMADCQDTFRYNELLGFRSNFEVVDGVYEIMIKDVT